jgi:Creatinine amidohydrolase
VLNGHIAPTPSVAINEACDFDSETFAVTMLHVTWLFRADATNQAQGERIAAQHFSAAERSSFGMDVHAGVAETSVFLALRPDLVHPTYKSLPNLAGRTQEELQAIATAPGWQGYMSWPAKATAAYGDLILRAVRGESLLKSPRVGNRIDPALLTVLGCSRTNAPSSRSLMSGWLASATLADCSRT